MANPDLVPCPHCGAQNGRSASFCWNCENSLAEAPAARFSAEDDAVRQAFLASEGDDPEGAAIQAPPPPIAPSVSTAAFDSRPGGLGKPADFGAGSFPVLTSEVSTHHPAVIPDHPPGFQPRGPASRWPSMLAAGAVLLVGGYWWLSPSIESKPSTDPAAAHAPAGHLPSPAADIAASTVAATVTPSTLPQAPPTSGIDEPGQPTSEAQAEKAFALPALQPVTSPDAPAKSTAPPAAMPEAANTANAVHDRRARSSSRAASSPTVSAPCTPTVAALGLCDSPSPATKE